METIPQNNERSIKEKYANKVDENGFVRVPDFATQELRRQSQSIASLLDGEGGLSPEYNLGEGIRYTGDSGNYDRMKVHIDDLEEFITRVKNHYK